MVLATWITVVILELIHAEKSRLLEEMYALSALDGRVLAYHGFNG